MDVTRCCITQAILEAAGYRRYRNSSRADSLREAYRDSYQKAITDERGKRYFIDIVRGHFYYLDRGIDREFVTPSVQFRRGDTTVEVEMIHHQETLAQVEAFFAEMWTTMRFDYYETHDGDDRQVPQGTQAGEQTN